MRTMKTTSGNTSALLGRDPAALARILYDYDKMMNVRGDRLVKHSDKLCV